MWQWIRQLWATKPATTASQVRRDEDKTTAGKAEPIADIDIPNAEQAFLLFYQRLLNAPEHPPGYTDSLRPEETSWLNARAEDLKRTPTQLTQLVPRLPSVLPRLMTALNNPDTPIRTLTALIESDPVISSMVLRLINSPAMRVRRENIDSLDQAVMLLGFSGMREVVSAAMFSPIGHLGRIEGANPLLVNDVWPISLRAANALRLGLKTKSDQSRPSLSSNEAFDLYLSVLIEHTGLIALLRQKPLTGPDTTAAYLACFRALVPAYSARIAEAWSLSENTIKLIRSAPAELDLLREEALYFSMSCALNRRGVLDQAQFLHLCRHLPDYAAGWYDLCVTVHSSAD
jgi:hypothetical protein